MTSTNSTYSMEFKQQAVQKLLAPGSPGLSKVARNLEIPLQTLHTWKKKYANKSVMKKFKHKTIEKWTPEEKLDAIIKTASMTENEFGEYLRSNGLHSSDLENFREASISGFKSKGRPKLDPELVELRRQKKTLERDLKRTQSALAEQSARIILLKKSHEIWGEPEDDE